ncbi:MAG: hypothetical protein WC459_03065 [Patescibacteria group bacterium]
MYNFFYKEDGYLNKYTLGLALLGVAGLLAGLILLMPQAIKAGKGILDARPQKMRLIVIKPQDCADCFDIYQVTDFIEQTLGIKYSHKKEYAAGSPNAELLIKTYKITTLPTFILQGDIEKAKLLELFDEASVAFSDKKTFVYANKFPPFYGLEDKTIQGRFNITYLTDKACDKCYDVYLHDIALNNLIMRPSASSTIDISSTEGKKFLSNYKIQYVPTILLSGDLDAYQNFKELWQTVGTIEKDGSYVFRLDGLKSMGAYKNLWTGRLENDK